MNQPRSNNSEVCAEQAASKKHQQFKMGLDVHAGSIVVVASSTQSAPQSAQKFTPGQFMEWVKTQGALAGTVPLLNPNNGLDPPTHGSTFLIGDPELSRHGSICLRLMSSFCNSNANRPDPTRHSRC